MPDFPASPAPDPPPSNPSSPPRKHVHIPVLLQEVLASLELRPGLTVVDGTIGAAGHSRRILEKIRPGGTLIGLDRDSLMLGFAAQFVGGEQVYLLQRSYSELPEVLKLLQIRQVDRVLVDLGLSSDQLADRQRGFGIQAGGPLDLRFDTRQGVPAAEYLETVSAKDLTEVFREYGEEPLAEKIANAIVDRRRSAPVATSEDLAELVQKVKGGRGDIHAATQVFQALRIAVNREFDHLRTFLADVLPACLASGGLAAVITFHSLEDRLVKETFRESERWDNLTKKPLVASVVHMKIVLLSRDSGLCHAPGRRDARLERPPERIRCRRGQ